MKKHILISSLVVLASNFAFAGTTVCKHGNNERKIEVTSSTAPCEVKYYKEGDSTGKVLWSAKNDAAFCETKAKEFASKVAASGYDCTGETPVAKTEEKAQTKVEATETKADAKTEREKARAERKAAKLKAKAEKAEAKAKAKADKEAAKAQEAQAKAEEKTKAIDAKAVEAKKEVEAKAVKEAAKAKEAQAKAETKVEEVKKSK